ncbi:hypothetical protein CFOL_v3_29715 [Cephalotus follicularis]|uniref:Reverse transcriptase/retrotransposon-derived protein RNase H-like domain-containing protein n=1 Tax=Cephalotus follicularis TaxID=3775 RepID=A0A1Q3D1W0_CEPFO|nr:hypothetical protein CFOL_v3_29715 [Cephalotus follicularis]
MHLVHLEKVWDCLTAHQLNAKLRKCTFDQSTIEYLGHIISKNGVQPDPMKLQAVMAWPSPTNVKQLRGFLGLTGYYRIFVKNYALIASPLTDLLRKDAFIWINDYPGSFETLKNSTMITPVLALTDFNSEFQVVTDASSLGMRAVLS